MESKYYRRPKKTWPGKKRPTGVRAADYGKPRIDPFLEPVFRKIGIPKPEPFKPDAFQLEALDLVRDYDVLVSAPTGAGKTWIASQTIRSYSARNLRVWYASPLKALSNSIYQQFCHEFGPANCGILTGDRKENSGAPIIVGTTEILRNQLYDSMHKGISIGTDLVILDEAHYLSDPDRGVVWEEVLIYLPPRVRLLLLSATISNAQEVCGWLNEIRGAPNRIVRSEERPVPLETLFLFPDGLIVPLGGVRGLSPKVKRFLASRPGKWGRRHERIDFGKVIRCLREFDLLPAIFFLKSRKDCDEALLTCHPVVKHPVYKVHMEETTAAFLEDYPHLKGHRQTRSLLKSLVASHHGGQLPYWKVLVEKMMNRGYLEAIFSTSTVAAGVNFPARTVVLVQSDRYNGHEFADLTATELHQMIGRAGRRGKDHIGFALIIPGLHQDPQLIQDLKDSQAEPIRSQIHINFSMTLNLLLSHTPLEVKDVLERSFAAFQGKELGPLFERRWGRMVTELEKTLSGGKCDVIDPYEILENIEIRSELQRRIKRLTQSIGHERAVDAYREYLKPGRLFLHKNANVYVVIHTYTDGGRFICAAHNVRKAVNARKGRPRLRKVDLAQVEVVFDHQLDIPEDRAPKRIEMVCRDVSPDDLKPLKIGISDQGHLAELGKVRQRLSLLPCESCKYLKICHGKGKSRLRVLLRDLRTIAVQMDGMGGGLWPGFKRHVRFLKETGFVDGTDRLTPDGYWASKLRLDQPLLIAEVIRKGILDGVDPEILAGGLAPFVWDRTQEVELRADRGTFDLVELEGIFNSILDSIEPIRHLKNKRGFESPQVLFWPAAALFVWAKGVPWRQLLGFAPVDEGDMASLIMRTVDHLRQVANLKETHPELASVAEEGIELILREPVYVI